MQVHYLYGLLGCLLTIGRCMAVEAQNAPPSISNLRVRLEASTQQLEITYDLADAEEKAIEVSLKISDDGGATYLVDASKATGDVGFPVTTGKAKKISWPYGSFKPGKGKVRLIANDRVTVNIQELVDQVDSVKLKENLTRLYGPRDHSPKALPHLNEVRNSIERHFQGSGLRAYRQDTSIAKAELLKNIFKALGGKGGKPPKQNPTYHIQNIIGALPGEYDSTTYLLTAHYDSAPGSPGADDNASGVAGIMEAARILSKYNFKHSIKFIGFDLEEEGFYGSFFYLLNGVRKYEKIKGCINFDMISYYSEAPNSQIIPDGFEIIFPEVSQRVIDDGKRGNFVVNTANTHSTGLGEHFTRTAGSYVPSLKVMPLVAHGNGEMSESLALSDHAPFWMMGVPALHIGDGGETRNLNLNTPKDVVDGNISYTFMSNIVKATLATLVSLAEIQHSTSATCDLN